MDTEADAKVSSAIIGGMSSSCDTVTTDCLENAFGRTFGQDECLGSGDAGIQGPLTFTTCSDTVLAFSVSQCDVATTVYLNVLVDWNADGDWTDALSCGPGRCGSEWAVRNHAFVAQPGCQTLTSPSFVVGSHPGEGWMRVTLTTTPAPNDYPWNGSSSMANGRFESGETEDYPVHIMQTTAVSEQLRAGFTIGIPAPNPAFSRVTFPFSVPQADQVEIAVFNIAGQRIQTLVAGRLEAGPHTAAWDGRDGRGRTIPAGVYRIRLRARGESVSRTLVWLGAGP